MVGSKENAAIDETGGDKTSSFGASLVSCSICLDLVTDAGGRSRAKLQCGHEFHLDCIGSAFNMKGAMQCPNCRKVERGRWLYANGSACSYPEFSMDEGAPYELSYSEMPFRVRWCPLDGFAPFHSSFESLRRGGSSFISSIVSPSHERMQVSHALHHQQPSSNPTNWPTSIISNVRRFNAPMGLPAVAPSTPQSDYNSGFYIFRPLVTSGRNLHEAERHLSRFPVISLESDLRWGSFHHAANGPHPGNRSGCFWRGHWS